MFEQLKCNESWHHESTVKRDAEVHELVSLRSYLVGTLCLKNKCQIHTSTNNILLLCHQLMDRLKLIIHLYLLHSIKNVWYVASQVIAAASLNSHRVHSWTLK